MNEELASSVDLAIKDSWDWPLLYYIGTVILQMQPTIFWKHTPRAISALMDIFVETKQGSTKSSGVRDGFIDEVL
jgi:hypothetical protein